MEVIRQDFIKLRIINNKLFEQLPSVKFQSIYQRKVRQMLKYMRFQQKLLPHIRFLSINLSHYLI
jgi:hypothetical protein